MSIFPGASNVLITGGSMTIHQGGQTRASDALDKLAAHAAHAALYNSAARFDAPRCHRNTRASYLDGLERWMLGQGEDYDGARLIWLTGGAGAGKSAIMQSIAERAAKNQLVLGSFFSFRTDATRNYAEVLIPTLAYQLACAFPAAMAVLEPVIYGNPLIFKASLQKQAQELLVRPLQHLISAGIIDATSASRLVFVVDGLDECQDPKKQALIVQVIADILSDHDLPVSLLVASRPEVAISRAIHAEKRIHSMLATITLDETDETESDIRQFIEDSFLDIRDSHPRREHIPEIWPHPYSVDRLVWNSSGHFIYAATAMKFILSSDEHPERALRVIEGLEPSRTGSPFAELDALYKHIITSSKYSSPILRILAHCRSSLNNTVTSICFMNPNYSPKDITLYLSDVTALVSLSLDNDAEMRVSLKHASLSDFLDDKKRSESLHMTSSSYLASCLPRYFDMLDIDPEVAASQLQHVHPNNVAAFYMIWATQVVNYFRDGNLLEQLISPHSPRDAWNLALHCVPLFKFSGDDSVFDLVYPYLEVIKSRAVNNHDWTLYNQQFGMFIQLLVDEIRFFYPEYWFIPALLFSTTPACLRWLPYWLMHQLTDLGLFPSSNIWLFNEVFSPPSPKLSLHLWRLPESQYWWGTDLAFIVKLVLQHLVNSSWVPEDLNAHQRIQWLQQINAVKNQSIDTPKHTSALSTRLFAGLPSLVSGRSIAWNAAVRLLHVGYNRDAALDIAFRRERCCIFLKAVVCYLPKSDCTSEIALLARRPLSREGELWFPRLARGARKLMDAYVQRWETSYEGVIEKTQSMAINDLD